MINFNTLQINFTNYFKHKMKDFYKDSILRKSETDFPLIQQYKI